MITSDLYCSGEQVLSPYGEKLAVLTTQLRIFFSDIRRKDGRYERVFSRNRFVSLIYGHGKEQNLTGHKNFLREKEKLPLQKLQRQ